MISCVNSNYLELSFKAALADYATTTFKTVRLRGTVLPSGGIRQYYYFFLLPRMQINSCHLVAVVVGDGRAAIQSHVEVKVSNAKGNLIRSCRRGKNDDYL